MEPAISLAAQYGIVGLFAALFGSAELVSRYKDEPVEIFWFSPAQFYVLLNFVFGCAALYCVHIYDLIGPADAQNGPTAKQVYLGQILAAGFGGAAFFRSSLAKTKVGGAEIGVGPSFVIDAYLAMLDRLVDRRQAERRVGNLPKQLREIPPDFAEGSLKHFCIGAMANISAEERERIDERMTIIRALDIDASIKSRLIGLELTKYVGRKGLSDALSELENEIKAAVETAEQQAKANTEKTTLMSWLSESEEPDPVDQS